MKSLEPHWMDAGTWQALADDSLTHRNPTDPDVADVLRICRHDADVDRRHALTASGWVVLI